ncbi:MAG: haloacid dehalogenase type II [Candidatus Eremiobacteraeota bacterium]|nr:haloacid dehalogenase type II [Candidatus Eremiobacteraeota bacterium]MBC5822665.1 haloacid dehalogenase type II [Candidatus Eremiobacteraeota bacterium]
MPPTIVLDVNETLLDMSALDPLFADAFGDKAVRRVWFAQTLQTALAMTLYGNYVPFAGVAKAALDMTARKRGVGLDGERAARIMRGLATLPAHGDVADGLSRLREAGCPIVVLAQASSDALEAQLTHAKLRPFIDRLFSADAIRRFKPAPETYALVRDTLDDDVPPLLISAHDWDLAGAAHAGWHTAFIARHGTALNPLEPPPTFSAPDLRTLAAAIVGTL